MKKTLRLLKNSLPADKSNYVDEPRVDSVESHRDRRESTSNHKRRLMLTLKMRVESRADHADLLEQDEPMTGVIPEEADTSSVYLFAYL